MSISSPAAGRTGPASTTLIAPPPGALGHPTASPGTPEAASPAEVVSRRPGRRVRRGPQVAIMSRVAAVAGAVALAIGLTAAPAQAHTSLTGATPAKGSVVRSPAQISLTYSDPVRLARVVVRDATGGHHESGPPRTADNRVTQPVAGALAPGVYTVGWRVVAPDGHPVTGTYTFTVRDGGTTTSPPAPTPSPAATTRPGGTDSGGTGWLWIGAGILVVLLVAGAIALLRRR